VLTLTPAADAAPKKQTTAVLNIAVNSGTTSLDPAKAGNGDPLQIFYELAYDPLIYRLPNGKLGPALATSWKYTDKENKVFEIKLRSGVKFSDGSELSAEGVKAHFEYYATAGGPFASRAKNFAKIEVLDPLTLRLTLTKANPDLPDMFTERRATGSIISPTALKSPASLGTTTAGAGAYMLDPKQTVTNQTYTYVPNPNYWDKKKQVFKKVVVKVIANPQAVLNAMQAGQVDYAIGTPQLAPAAIKAGFKVNSFPYNFAQIQILDRAGKIVEAFGDVRVRQAMNYAIDRVALAKALFGKYGSANNQFALPGYDAYDKSLEKMYPYNVKKAKDLLKAAGYPNGFSFDLLAYDLQPNEVKNAQAIASYWKKVGIEAKIVVPSSAAEYGPMLTSGKYAAQIFEFGGGPLYQTLDQYLGMPFNALNYQDAEINGLFAKAAAANDATRPAINKRIQKLMLDEAWFVPFASVNKVTFSRPGLLGTNGAPMYINPNPIFFTVQK
jgi:peptide/nickel transport system substrate-binding protein